MSNDRENGLGKSSNQTLEQQITQVKNHIIEKDGKRIMPLPPNYQIYDTHYYEQFSDKIRPEQVFRDVTSTQTTLEKLIKKWEKEVALHSLLNPNDPPPLKPTQDDVPLSYDVILRLEGEMSRGNGGYFFEFTIQAGRLIVWKVDVPPIGSRQRGSYKEVFASPIDNQRVSLPDPNYGASYEGCFTDNLFVSLTGNKVPLSTHVGVVLAIAANMEKLTTVIGAIPTMPIERRLFEPILNALAPNPTLTTEQSSINVR